MPDQKRMNFLAALKQENLEGAVALLSSLDQGTLTNGDLVKIWCRAASERARASLAHALLKNLSVSAGRATRVLRSARTRNLTFPRNRWSIRGLEIVLRHLRDNTEWTDSYSAYRYSSNLLRDFSDALFTRNMPAFWEIVGADFHDFPLPAGTLSRLYGSDRRARRIIDAALPDAPDTLLKAYMENWIVGLDAAALQAFEQRHGALATVQHMEAAGFEAFRYNEITAWTDDAAVAFLEPLIQEPYRVSDLENQEALQAGLCKALSAITPDILISVILAAEEKGCASLEVEGAEPLYTAMQEAVDWTSASPRSTSQLQGVYPGLVPGRVANSRAIPVSGVPGGFAF